MEIAIAGEGQVLIRFIDQKGRTLVQEKITVSGSPTVQAKRSIALSVETTGGAKLLAPVLVQQSNPQQRVTFDGEQPSRFTRKRCKEIGCPKVVTVDAARGRAASPVPSAVLESDDEMLAGLIHAIAEGKAKQGK